MFEPEVRDTAPAAPAAEKGFGEGEGLQGAETSAEEDSGFLYMDVDIDSIPDQELIPDGTEALFRLKKAVVKKSKDNPDSRWVEAYISVEDFINAPLITHRVFLPKPDDDDKKRQDKLRNLKDFKNAFGIVQDAKGLRLAEAAQNQPTCWGIVGIEADKTGQYPDKNKIKRFIVRR